MSILNKAILTGGLVMGVAFSAMAHPELKSSVPQADSAVCHHILRCRSRQKWRQALTLNRWSLFRESLYPLALIVLTGARFLQIRTLLPVITPLQ